MGRGPSPAPSYAAMLQPSVHHKGIVFSFIFNSLIIRRALSDLLRYFWFCRNSSEEQASIQLQEMTNAAVIHRDLASKVL